jgi:hypothetical protein
MFLLMEAIAVHMRSDVGLAGYRGYLRVLRLEIGYHPGLSFLFVEMRVGFTWLLPPCCSVSLSRSKWLSLNHLGVADSMSLISDGGLLVLFQLILLCLFSSISRSGDFGATFRRGRIGVTQCFSSRICIFGDTVAIAVHMRGDIVLAGYTSSLSSVLL